VSKGGEFERTFFQQKLMWSLNEDARAVTAVSVAPRCAAMLQVAQHLQRVSNNLMRSSPFDISDKTHATSIVLMAWIVQTLFLWSIDQSV
jgi:hypothetical protein